MDSLEEVNDSVVRNVEDGAQISLEVLVDCQDSAIAVGNEIENCGADGEEVVHLLEAYCENLYQMSTKLDDAGFCRKLAKKIQKQLVQIRNHVKYDLPEDKKEIVFLPYKASMWDSLESVWKAADADPDCDAYVIPIPYFDKNPDGSFKEEHYEGDLYPKDVPITRYDEYDLEARRPNLIYIHNPYDECNHVTSVYPYFYAKNLRNFTDKLVYIPYFVLSEIEPDNQTAIDGMKHFCFTPGTIYAHQVIVQSENMRQIYINEYMKAAKEMGLGGEHVDRKFLEKKFLGTGSPKFDKVLNTRKEDLEIPAEWLKIIEKPDGSWKKIVFYNTSVSALLKHDEQMLRKMESVFGIFKENRDEVALLWRPHPLIQATIESMRPQLWAEYDKLVRKYREESWGIYDDSVELDRAVVLSDAYYGDWSSVVQLCRKKGLPVMVQDVNTQNATLSYFPGVIDAAFQEENNVWFVSNEDNILWQMDIETKELQYIMSLPVKNEGNTYRMNTRCIKVGNKIFCLPDQADKVMIYNIRTGQMESCNVDANAERIGIYNSWVCDDTIWCVSYFMQQIIEIDAGNRRIVGRYPVFERSDTLIGYEAVFHKGYIYCVSRNTTKVCRFDTKSKEKKYYDLQVEDKGFNTIAVDGEVFYLTGYRKAVYVWNEDDNGIATINQFPPEYIVSDHQDGMKTDFFDRFIFYRSHVMKSYVLFLPWNFPEAFSNGIIAWSKSNQKIVFIEGGEEKQIQYSFCYEKPDEIIGIYCSAGNCMIEVDKNFRVRYINRFDTPEYGIGLTEKRSVTTEGTVYDLNALMRVVRGEF